jgi:hypothetical protein
VNIVPCGYSSLLINDFFDSFDFVGIICVCIKESCVTYMTERVYRDKTEKFDLIKTTLDDICGLNDRYIGFEASRDYKMNINFAYRTCHAYGMIKWINISNYALTACNEWDALKVQPENAFLLMEHIEPLNVKLSELRIMVNNFSVDPNDDDNHYWIFVNDQLKISDAADENPVEDTRRRINPQNATREDETHHGNPGDPNIGDADISHPNDVQQMLSQLEHYI